MIEIIVHRRIRMRHGLFRLRLTRRLASFPSSWLYPTGEQLTFYARRHAALVQSNTPVAKPELISDKKSLFDTVPLLKLFCGSLAI